MRLNIFMVRSDQIRRICQIQKARSKAAGIAVLVVGGLLAASLCFGAPTDPSQSTNIFKPQSTPAHSIFHLSMLVLAITGAIFAVVSSLLAYSVAKFRKRANDDGREPAQVYGSNQIELAWTVIPILIVLVLFLATARVIRSIQDAPQPPGAIDVTAIGHQFWWEFRYPALGVVTANELHVPVSNPANSTPTFLTLLSADTDHSFWVPRLAGKTDLIPNHPNRTWIDPQETGLYLGQCAQYCGTQHAKMLLRVYVESPEQFKQWVEEQKKPAVSDDSVAEGRRIFETTACVNCHAISDTIASGVASNNRENLRAWIQSPDSIKPGSLMPARQLPDHDLDALTAYLVTLR